MQVDGGRHYCARAVVVEEHWRPDPVGEAEEVSDQNWQLYEMTALNFSMADLQRLDACLHVLHIGPRRRVSLRYLCFLECLGTLDRRSEAVSREQKRRCSAAPKNVFFQRIGEQLTPQRS